MPKKLQIAKKRQVDCGTIKDVQISSHSCGGFQRLFWNWCLYLVNYHFFFLINVQIRFALVYWRLLLASFSGHLNVFFFFLLATGVYVSEEIVEVHESVQFPLTIIQFNGHVTFHLLPGCTVILITCDWITTKGCKWDNIIKISFLYLRKQKKIIVLFVWENGKITSWIYCTSILRTDD